MFYFGTSNRQLTNCYTIILLSHYNFWTFDHKWQLQKSENIPNYPIAFLSMSCVI